MFNGIVEKVENYEARDLRLVSIRISKDTYEELEKSFWKPDDIINKTVTVFTEDDSLFGHFGRLGQLEKENQELREQVKDLEEELSSAQQLHGYWENTYSHAVDRAHDVGVEMHIEYVDMKKNSGAVCVYNKRAHKLEDRNATLISENSELKKELKNLKSKTVAEARYEWKPNCFTLIYTMCDGSKQTVGMDLSSGIGATSISCGTIPKCSSCSHFMRNPSHYAHYGCYMSSSKEGGIGYLRMLSKEEAEGPACDKFEAKG